MLVRKRKQLTLQSKNMTLRSFSSECTEQGNEWVRTTDDMEERRLTEKCKDIGKETKEEVLIILLAFSILEIELLAGSSFCDDVTVILRDSECYVNLFKTRIKDVECCRVTQESVV